MLLAHRGGIRHEWDVPGLWDVLWKREAAPVEERGKMARAMLTQPPKVTPGQYFYSNCGYGIAGHMVETITDKPWEQHVRELVFEPLGMQSAGFGVPWESEVPTDPWPHKRDGSPIPPGPMADNPPSIGPGGTIHASIGDWAKYIIEKMRGARGEDGLLLDADTYRRLHQGRRIEDSEDEYALGWMVVHRPWAKGNSPDDDGRCLHHAGSNNSWFALVWIAEEIFPEIDAVIWTVTQDYLERLQ